MGGVAILTVYINYANYICAILGLLAYSHKYSARINNQLYSIMYSICTCMYVHVLCLMHSSCTTHTNMQRMHAMLVDNIHV